MRKRDIIKFMKKHNIPNPNCAKMFMKNIEEKKEDARRESDKPEKEGEGINPL